MYCLLVFTYVADLLRPKRYAARKDAITVTWMKGVGELHYCLAIKQDKANKIVEIQ